MNVIVILSRLQKTTHHYKYQTFKFFSLMYFSTATDKIKFNLKIHEENRSAALYIIDNNHFCIFCFHEGSITNVRVNPYDMQLLTHSPAQSEVQDTEQSC